MQSLVPPPNPLTANRESIFFVSLPKSGTVFTWYMLEKASGLAVPRFHELQGWGDYSAGYDFAAPHLYACGDYNTQLLRQHEMYHYLKGYIFGAHMQASYHNMRVLKESGIRKITVLLRDPRDAFVSWIHHLRKLGPTARDYHSKIYAIPRSYYDWSLAEQFAYQIRTFLPVTVNWIEGWLDYFASTDREIDIQFVYYDELKRNPRGYIAKILAFHDFKDGDVSGVAPPAAGEMHYRKGQHGQWREEFTSGDQNLVADLMQDRVTRGFEQAAAAHPANERAKALQGAGQYMAAAAEKLRVLSDFPNYRAGYAAFAEMVDAAGGNASALRDAVAATLSDATEEQFVYRDELLQIAEGLMGGAA